MMGGVEFCPSCGARRLADARFCGSCGLNIGAWEFHIDAVAPGEAEAEESEGSSDGTLPLDAEIVDPSGSSVTPGASMQTARTFAASVGLPDGSVLVIGGQRNGTPLASAERYDPRTQSWSPAGTMRVPRVYATATSLPDGRVLVVGGGSAPDPNEPGVDEATSSAEIFDPTSDTWQEAASMSTVRALHTATLLGNGRVLVAGGASTDGGTTGAVYASAESYDPATDTWSPAGSMSSFRYAHSAVTHANGDALVAGGWSSQASDAQSLATAEIYAQSTNTWSPAGSMSAGRGQMVMADLPDGRVLAVGGLSPSYGVNSSVDVYDPASGLWQAAADLRRGIYWPAIVVLTDGHVLVAGGARDAAANLTTDAVEVYTSQAVGP
jgi:hypothetical protein